MRATLTWAAAALMMAASAVTAGAQTPTEINFGVISTEASMNQKKNWEPFLQAMSKATGLKVNGFYATDYAGVIKAMRFNKIHLAWYGNKSGMEAVDRANGEVFAHIVARDGSVGYYSHVIVHKDSPFAKIDDILKCDKSLDFGIGDPNSTSGFLVPTSYIFAERNLDPKTCFKTVRNANHQANAMAVANKQVAAATNNSEDLQRVAGMAIFVHNLGVFSKLFSEAVEAIDPRPVEGIRAHRCARVARSRVRRRAPGDAAVELAHALSARDQCALRNDARHRGRGGNRSDALRKHPQLPIRRDGRAGHHCRRNGCRDRHAQRSYQEASLLVMRSIAARTATSAGRPCSARKKQDAAPFPCARYSPAARCGQT